MILIINKSRKEAQRLSEMFYFMGIVSYAATPSEALAEISTVYSAVIVMNPSILPDKEDYVFRLRSYANLPTFAISDAPESIDGIIFDGVMKGAPYASKILSYITNFCTLRGLKSPGLYKLAGIDASVNLITPVYLSKALPFTKTELMILRTLIATYPAPIKASLILKYAFKPTKKPELPNIRTHVSIMNKKFRSITDRNVIILTPSEGYKVLTPEIKEALVN